MNFCLTGQALTEEWAEHQTDDTHYAAMNHINNCKECLEHWITVNRRRSFFADAEILSARLETMRAEREYA